MFKYWTSVLIWDCDWLFFFLWLNLLGSHIGLGHLLYHAVLQKVMHFIPFFTAISELLQSGAKVDSYEGAKSYCLSMHVAF